MKSLVQVRTMSWILSFFVLFVASGGDTLTEQKRPAPIDLPDTKKAIEYFEQVLRKDPLNALAYAGLAEAYSLSDLYGFPDYFRPKEVMPKARAAALKALELNERLAESHVAMAELKFRYDWDWYGAETEYKRAEELNPRDAKAHAGHALVMASLGKSMEAFLQLKKAEELDSRSPYVHYTMGKFYYFARVYDRALEEFNKTSVLDPRFGAVPFFRGLCYVQKSMFDSGIAELRKSVDKTQPSPSSLAALGFAYAASGKTVEAKKILRELTERSRREYVALYLMAAVYAALNDKEQAIQSLNRAYGEHEDWLVWLKIDPRFDNLRSDPRFADLLRRVGHKP